MIRSLELGLWAAPVILFTIGEARTQEVKATILGNFDEDRFGWSVASVGDVDGDGRFDYVIGALRDDDGGLDSGTIRLVSGATGTGLLTVSGTAGQKLGYSVGGAGDIDGDGVPDFIGGAPDANFELGFYGAYSGATGALLQSFTPSDLAGAKRFGEAALGAGDVDLDGVPDVIVGAPLESHTFSNGGRVRVFSGQTGALIRQMDGTTSSANLGASIAVFDDLIQSGHPDFLVGAPGQLGTGYAHVFAGQNGALLFSVTAGPNGLNRFGASVAVLEDITADGFQDFVVGAPRLDSVGVDSGGVFLYRGLFSTLIHQWDGLAAGDEFGTIVGNAGDLNGDGKPEILVGAPKNDATGLNAGAAYVYEADTSLLYTVLGVNAGDAFGRSGAGLGDVDGDGVNEFGVGAPDADNAGNLSGLVEVYSRDCGQTVALGASCPTSVPSSPQLAVDGCFVGGGIVSLEITSGVPGGVALVFLGFPSAPIPLPGGCALLLSPLPTPIVLPLDASGGIWIGTSLPIGTGLIPFAMQALMADAGLPSGLAGTNSVSITPP